MHGLTATGNGSPTRKVLRRGPLKSLHPAFHCSPFQPSEVAPLSITNLAPNLALSQFSQFPRLALAALTSR